MCNACGFLCCGSDALAECGCDSCHEAKCAEVCPDCHDLVEWCHCDDGPDDWDHDG